MIFFVKMILKRPLSRGSHFKIHFSLGFRENRGSSQNFHEIPFSGDHKIIIPCQCDYSNFIINTCYTYLNMGFNLNMNARKYRHKHRLIHTKVQHETTICTRSDFSPFSFFKRSFLTT